MLPGFPKLFRLRPFAPVRLFVAVTLAGSLLSLGAGFVVIRLLPAQYVSVARIKIERNTVATAPAPAAYATFTPYTDPGYDPHFIETVFACIRSDAILTNVINGLNLNTAWGEKRSGGKPLATAETMARLNRRLEIRPVRCTKLISLGVASGAAPADRAEAARLANAIATSYQTCRKSARQQQLADLDRQARTLDAQIQAARPQPDTNALKNLLARRDAIACGKTLLDQAADDGKVIDAAAPATHPIPLVNPVSPFAAALGGITLGLAAVLASFLITRRNPKREPSV